MRAAHNLNIGSKVCPIVSQCRDVAQGLVSGDFNKVALNSSVLALSAISSGSSSKVVGLQTSRT